MRGSILGAALVLAALAVVGLSAPAWASEPFPDVPDASPARPVGSSWREVTYDHGKVVRIRVDSPRPSGRELKARAGSSTYDVFAGADPAFDVTDPADGTVVDADADFASCRQVDVSEPSYTLLHFTAYRFHHTVFFCWRYPRITVYSAGTYISDVDSSYEWRGIVASSGHFYTWRVDPRGGHYSFRQGQFENCIQPWGPCLGNEYPWVRIWVNGNGAWSYDKGGGRWIG